MGVPKHLTWIFAGLFVASALPLAIVEDRAWGHRWAGLSLVCLGGFAFSMVRDAVKSGEVRFNLSRIRRADSPRLFWATLALIASAGIGVLATAGWVLFFKPI